ncbi:MAG: cytochrome c oxidase assembly protein [Chloroflexi bacterium]|nr:cytochrome c oxidase assembly protein [Chloroflexota bacterium]
MQLHLVPGAIEAAHPAHVNHTGDLWGAWNVDPQLLVPLALAAVWYARGLSRWPERSREHPRWRSALFYAGLLVLLLAIESPLDAAAEHHLTFHMVQHELLVLIAPSLILLGAPTTPLLRGLPRELRLGVVGGLARRRAVRRGGRLLTHPLLAGGLFTAVLWLWHLAPGWYEAALTSEWIHELQHASFVAVGFLVWWNLVDPAPLRARLGYLPRILFLLAIGVPKHILGALLTFASDPFYDYYEGRQLLDISLATDQQIGGLIMWAPSQLLMLGVAAVIFAVWYGKSGQGQPDEPPAARARRPGAGSRGDASG